MELERELAEMHGLTSRVAKEVPMIEVAVHDVMLRAPKDDPEAAWLPGRGKKYKLGFTRVLLLKEQAGRPNSSHLARGGRRRCYSYAFGRSLYGSAINIRIDGTTIRRCQDEN